MNRAFSNENPFWSGMEKVFQIFVLNCVWLLCCIPIFTIGPSTTGLFYALIGLNRGDGHGYPYKDFFKSFKRNFKQGIAMGIPLTVIGVVLVLAIYLSYNSESGFYTFSLFFCVVLFALWAAVTIYYFPLLAKFDKKNLDLLAWAFVLCIKHLPRTLASIAIIGVCIWVCTLLPGLMLVIFGFAAQGITFFLLPLINPYLPDPLADEEEFDGGEELDKSEED